MYRTRKKDTVLALLRLSSHTAIRLVVLTFHIKDGFRAFQQINLTHSALLTQHFRKQHQIASLFKEIEIFSAFKTFRSRVRHKSRNQLTLLLSHIHTHAGNNKPGGII